MDSPTRPILDLRPETDFLAGHHPDAANIPLDELPRRVHELPPRFVALAVVAADPSQFDRARRELAEHGFEGVTAFASSDSSMPQVAGLARARLWRPHDWLVAALELFHREQPHGRALDLACGAGRDAVHLALDGWTVDACDLLPDALDRARDLAARNGVSINFNVADLEGSPQLPSDRYDLVTMFNFLHRPLFDAVRRAVRPGGWFVCETFVDPQIEQFGKPRRRERVLRSMELPAYFDGWQLIRYRETQTHPRRLTAGLIAQRPLN